MSESTFEVGALAEHTRKSEWGRGKVVKVRSPYVWVFFREAPGRAARQFPESLLVRSSCQTDPVLDNLVALVEKDGVLVLPTERYTLAEGLGLLRTLAPVGFGEGGASKPHRDRDKRRAAHAAWQAALGDGQAEALLAADDVAGLTRRLLPVISAAGALSTADAAGLRQALEDEGVARAYYTALLAYLAELSQETFEAYAAATAALFGDGGTASWPVVTLLPSLAQPERHMLLQPTLTCAAAHRLGFEFPYQATPAWPTYAALLRLGGAYLEPLTEHGARDLNDVHLYMAALVARPASARKAAA